MIRRKKFSESVSSYFLLYFFGVGTKLRFLFKSLKVSKENECFDKLITFPDRSDLYLIFAFNCSFYADSVSIVRWIKVSTFIISVLFVAWPPDVEAICTFLNCLR